MPGRDCGAVNGASVARGDETDGLHASANVLVDILCALTGQAPSVWLNVSEFMGEARSDRAH